MPTTKSDTSVTAFDLTSPRSYVSLPLSFPFHFSLYTTACFERELTDRDEQSTTRSWHHAGITANSICPRKDPKQCSDLHFSYNPAPSQPAGTVAPASSSRSSNSAFLCPRNRSRLLGPYDVLTSLTTSSITPVSASLAYPQCPQLLHTFPW